MLDEKRNGFSLSERGLASASDRRDLHRFGIYVYRFYQLRAVGLEDVSCNESLCVVDTVGLTGRSEASLRRSNGCITTSTPPLASLDGSAIQTKLLFQRKQEPRLNWYC